MDVGKGRVLGHNELVEQKCHDKLLVVKCTTIVEDCGLIPQTMFGHGWKDRVIKELHLTAAKVIIIVDGREELVMATTEEKKLLWNGVSWLSQLKVLKE